MANSFFKFKQFTIHHDLCAMKVGTDGVLLGAWVSINNPSNILDIGTGTGLIALILAQRSNATIHAIDIDANAIQQATKNINNSPFASRIKTQHASCSDFTTECKEKYDLIISNPPYFSHSLKCPDSQRSTARHNDSLSLEELIPQCKSVLLPHGRIAFILPFSALPEVTRIANNEGLHSIRETTVIPIPGALPKRILIELSAIPVSMPTKSTLIIEETRHQYTPEYINLTKDFYLKM